MLIETIINDLTHLKLQGMLEGLRTQQTKGQLGSLSLLDGLGLLVSDEKLHRENKRQQRLLKQAKLRFAQANVESIDYDYPRKLPKDKMRYLLQCDWIHQSQNIVFIGATGLGKSYLACALGQLACRRGYSTRYFRVSKLLESLRLAQAAGSLSQTLMNLAKQSVLLLDDWGLEPLNQQQRNHLLEIIEDRHSLHPVIISTQLSTQHWHEYIGDNTIADALLDRVLAKSEIISLEGDSMRGKEKLP